MRSISLKSEVFNKLVPGSRCQRSSHPLAGKRLARARESIPWGAGLGEGAAAPRERQEASRPCQNVLLQAAGASGLGRAANTAPGATSGLPGTLGTLPSVGLSLHKIYIKHYI